MNQSTMTVIEKRGGGKSMALSEPLIKRKGMVTVLVTIGGGKKSIDESS